MGTVPGPAEKGRSLARARPVLAGLALAGAALWCRAAYIQVVRHPFLRDKAERQHVGRIALPASRGAIVTRDGHKVAWNLWRDSVYVVPTLVDSPDVTASRLAGVLGIDAAQTARRIEEKRRAGKLFCWVSRWVEPAQADAVAALKLPGVGMRKEPLRQYPWEENGAAVVGFVGVDGKGLAGLERAWEALLGGVPGVMPLYRDARGKILITTPPDEVVQPADGRDLTLTLESCIQAIADQEVAAAWESLKPVRVAAIVMDSRTGEVLGIAARPSYDPNAFRRADPRAFNHPGAAFVYEPGSTFKPFVLALALARGTVALDRRFDCHMGEWKVGNRVLRDAHPYGILSAADVIVHSSNIGIAQIGATLPPPDLRAGLAAFGFGRRTGMGLPGEEAGIFHPLSRWTRETPRSIPMGYEIATTPVQLLAAFNVFANGGTWVRPSLLLDGKPSETRRILPPDVVRAMGGVLRDVVVRGTGTKAESEYAVAGKTGTSRKLGPDGKYRPNAHIGSFVAYAPAEDPRISVIVVVDEPRGGEYYGGAVAAPVAREIIRRTLSYLDVPPSPPTPKAKGAPPASRKTVSRNR